MRNIENAYNRFHWWIAIITSGYYNTNNNNNNIENIYYILQWDKDFIQINGDSCFKLDFDSIPSMNELIYALNVFNYIDSKNFHDIFDASNKNTNKYLI